MTNKIFKCNVIDFKAELPYDFCKAKKITIKFNSKQVCYENPINYREPIMYLIHEKYIYFKSKELNGDKINNIELEMEYLPYNKIYK